MKVLKKVLAFSLAVSLLLETMAPVMAVDAPQEDQNDLIVESASSDVIDVPVSESELVDFLVPDEDGMQVMVHADRSSCMIGEPVVVSVAVTDGGELETVNLTCAVFLNGEEIEQIQQQENVLVYTPQREGQLMFMVTAETADGRQAVGFSEAIVVGTPASEVELMAASADAFTYEILNGTYCRITAYSGAAEELEIPSLLDGYLVQSISDGVFANHTELTKVILPQTLETMGSSMFSGCSNLEEVVLNEALTGIPDSAFQSCTSLQRIALPESVTYIGNQSFLNCSALNEILFSENLTTIGSYAFLNCVGLETVEIANSVTTLGRGVFSNCTALTAVRLPLGWTECVSEHPSWSSADDHRGYMFEGCTSLKTVELPEGMTTLPDYALRGNPYLEEVVLPASLQTIGSCAFLGCTGLKTVTFSEGSQVTTIKSDAFRGCTALAAVELPETVSTLGTYVFSVCTALTEITVPKAVTVIPEGCFDGCGKLETVVVEGAEEINVVAFRGCKSLKEVSLPDSLTTIWHYAFQNCTGLETITIPDSVTTLGRGVFSNCTALTAVRLPLGWTECPSEHPGWSSADDHRGYMFEGCTSLKTVELPEGMTTLPDYALRGNPHLEEVVLPASLQTIGVCAFQNDKNLNVIRFAENGGLQIIGANAFQGCTGFVSIYFPETLQEIGSYAFQNCTGLRQIGLNKGLVQMGSNAFQGCKGLVRVELPGSLTAIPDYAFEGCSGLRSITVGEGTGSIGMCAFSGCAGVTSVTLPESLTAIGHYGFQNCTSLPELHLPDGVRSLGYRVFNGCVKLAAVNYPLSWTECPSEHPNWSSANDYRGAIFVGCTQLTRLKVPEGVVSIPDYALRDSGGLREVILPESLTAIGAGSFRNCGSLEQIWIGEGVTSIGSNCFTSCSLLTIHGVEGSYAQTYAETNGIPFSTQTLVYPVGCVEGVVTDENGTGIPGVRVTVYDLTEQEQFAVLTTDADGCWRAEEVRIGYSYQFHFYHTEYTIGENTQSFEITEETITAKPVIAISRATGAVTPEADFTVTVLNGAYCQITGYTGDAAEVVIPAQIGDHTVQSLAANAFKNNTKVTKVVLPETVETIGSSVFAGCSSLEIVILNHGLESISSYAFQNCAALHTVELPGTMSRIGEYAFQNCTALKELKLSSAVKTLDSGSFWGCTGLEKLELSLGLVSIGHYAFRDCTGLTEVALPGSVTTLGRGVFSNCTALTAVRLPLGWTECVSEHPGWSSADDHRGYMFEGCTSLKTVELPEGMTTLPDYALRGNPYLEEVVLPASLQTIGSCAFLDCTGLKTVTFPEGSQVTTIKSDAFRGCTALASVELPETVSTLGTYVFAGCTALTEITAPKAVTVIPEGCFDGCGKLETVVVEGAEEINVVAFRGCKSLKEVSLPDSLTTIWHYAFQNCTGLETITIPDSVTTLGRGVFSNCTALTAVRLPLGWTECPSEHPGWSSADDHRGYMFEGCTSLKTAELPEGMTTLPDYALRGNPYLEEVVLPASLQTIGVCAFQNDKNLNVIRFAENGGLQIIGANAFQGCTGFVSVYFPETLQEIGSYAFQNCTGLRQIGLNEGLVQMGSNAFQGCKGLVRVELPGSLTAIPDYAFEGCSGLRSIIVGEGTGSIGMCVFSGCAGVTSVTLPESLTAIGHYGFQNCTSLPELHLPDGVRSLGYRVFNGCVKLAAVNYPLSWTECPSEHPGWSSANDYRGAIFVGCTQLTKLEIPEGVTEIPAYAFRGCEGLRYVLLPDGLETIHDAAFNGSGLKSVSVPESLGEIRNAAFAGCKNLETVYVPHTVEQDVELGTDVFGKCAADLVITCNNATNTYYYAESAEISIKALDDHEHEFVEFGKTEATCIAAGQRDLGCGVCGYQTIEVLPALGHEFEETFTIDREATCLELGRQSRHCTRCVATTDEQDIPASGHVFGGWIVLEPATVLKSGSMTRYCQYCEETEIEVVPKLVLTESMMDSYGLVHFNVVHAQTLEAVANASICIETDEGDITVISDEDGTASHILPVGKYACFVKAPGCLSRSLKITVRGGEQYLPEIGVSEREPVEVELKHHLMTYEEILAAGIDPNGAGNTHVFKYELKLQYRAELDLITLSYMFNADGLLQGVPQIYLPGTGGGGTGTPGKPGGGFHIGEPPKREPVYGKGSFSFWVNDGEEEMQVHVTEKFLLIIHGEVKWLKEMFDVEMIILNVSATDTIENCEAELILPEGLSLATMRQDVGQQTLRQAVPVIESNQTHTVHWYVRGDVEGSYDITATLDGMMMPFEEEFHYEYCADDPIKVYAGSAMRMVFEVPEVVYYGTNADVRITLTNVSDRTLYNVSHSIANVEQRRLTYKTENGEKTLVSNELLGSDVGGKIWVSEFRPGDQLIVELSIEIAFESKELKKRFKEIIDDIRKLSDLANVADAFDSAGSAAEDLSGFLSDANKAVEAGKLTYDAIKAADSFGKLTDYMDFGKGESSEPTTPGFFSMLEDLVDSLPIRYVLENVSVETLKESTTSIPYTIKRVPGPPVNPLIPAGSISMSKLIYSIAVVMIGDVDVKVGGMTLVKDASGKQEAMEYVKYVWEQTAAIRALDPTGEVHFRAWYEPSDPSSLAEVDVRVTGGQNLTYEKNGVVSFYGPGLIEVTPRKSVSLAADDNGASAGGTIYVQAGDEAPKAYQFDVVEPHTCAGDTWDVEVPATEHTAGFKTMRCDICEEIIHVEKMESCGDHEFAPYVTELLPADDQLGIQTRTCTKCGVMEYRLIEDAPVENVTELVTDRSGTLVTRGDTQYLVVEPGMTVAGFLETLSDPSIMRRTDAAGTALQEEALATGQQLTAEGAGGMLVLVVPGDLDGDGSVTDTELSQVLQMSLSGVSGTELARIAADLNADGVVSLREVAKTSLLTEQTETSWHVVLGLYEASGKLISTVIAEGTDRETAAQELAGMDWEILKLFVLDKTTAAPLGRLVPRLER